METIPILDVPLMMTDSSTIALFSLPLGLNESWILTDLRFEPDKRSGMQELLIDIGFKPKGTHPCPMCGKPGVVDEGEERI